MFLAMSLLKSFATKGTTTSKIKFALCVVVTNMTLLSVVIAPASMLIFPRDHTWDQMAMQSLSLPRVHHIPGSLTLGITQTGWLPYRSCTDSLTFDPTFVALYHTICICTLRTYMYIYAIWHTGPWTLDTHYCISRSVSCTTRNYKHCLPLVVTIAT